MRAQLPPEPRVVGDVGRARQQRRGVAEVLEVAHRARHARARPAADRHLAGRGQAGVAAVAKRRVGGQGLQQREVPAQPVEGADRRLGVRHPDVDVQAADRRGDGVAEQVADALVALLVGDLGLAFGGRRMRARAEQPRARVDDGPPQAVEHVDRLAGAGADVGDELELTGVELALHRAAHVPIRSWTAVDALICVPVTGSTRNSSSSTPTVKGWPDPKACPLRAGDRDGCSRSRRRAGGARR